MRTILAIDFETADHGADSACAVGAALVLDGRIVHAEAHLIRPPRPNILFTDIHGLRWCDVADAPDMAGVWEHLAPLVGEADLLAAHNAGFDRAVLRGSLARHGLRPVDRPWLCTVRLSRAVWNIRPTRLPDVCERFGIDLDHHNALSDARACAAIVVRALEEGGDLAAGLLRPARTAS